MRTQRYGKTVKLWLSANDTDKWARRTGESWPCSELSGKRVFAEFCDGDLVDLRIDGKDGDVSANEFNAIVEDFLGSINPT